MKILLIKYKLFKNKCTAFWNPELYHLNGFDERQQLKQELTMEKFLKIRFKLPQKEGKK